MEPIHGRFFKKLHLWLVICMFFFPLVLSQVTSDCSSCQPEINTRTTGLAGMTRYISWLVDQSHPSHPLPIWLAILLLKLVAFPICMAHLPWLGWKTPLPIRLRLSDLALWIWSCIYGSCMFLQNHQLLPDILSLFFCSGTFLVRDY